MFRFVDVVCCVATPSAHHTSDPIQCAGGPCMSLVTSSSVLWAQASYSWHRVTRLSAFRQHGIVPDDVFGRTAVSLEALVVICIGRLTDTGGGTCNLVTWRLKVL